MTRRTRNILIDNENKVMYRDITDVVSASPANRVDAKPQARTFKKRGVLKPTWRGIGSVSGLRFPSSTFVSTLQLTLDEAPAGQAAIVEIRIGTTSRNKKQLNTTQQGTYSIAAGQTEVTYNINTTFTSSQYIYINVIQTGTGKKKGKNIQMTLTYFKE